MKPVHAPVSRAELRREMSQLTPVTVFRGVEVFAFWGAEFPLAMREVGRLREKVFRAAGAGRGEPIDVDPLDYAENAYQQLVAFDAEASEFVALVRFQRGSGDDGERLLRTSSLFEYGEMFRRKVLPHGVELGRSVVNDEAKRSRVVQSYLSPTSSQRFAWNSDP